ncbi:MAG: GGDEF domain-containing protein, partial [Anaerovorax sp.]
ILNDFECCYQTKHRDFSVIFLDLDNFKHINDLYGHKGGDELLKITSEKLQACMEQKEFVARMGGDEFMAIMPCTEETDIERKMQRIQEEFQQKFLFAGQMYEIKISAGYSVFSQVEDLPSLMQQADEAMYNKKRQASLQMEK